ncbi:HEAT repeat domain-containing protein [Actinomadura sp. WAC 06369]|uniref:HEAT repeat domain-containing protein n=1 Tax=Actinomadura sp. WAC 06369 TaxID=2203193 RepID=UPI000F79007F|nr:HEAT repeat domain-containing protein [Actinomadura sp. WAC 06369]
MSPTAELIAAVRGRDPRTAEELLRAGADPDAVDGDGTAVLGRAAANADAATVGVLLAAGADPDRRSRGGGAPLMLAADAGAVEAVLELFGASPRLSLRDDRGRTALDLARAWLGVDPEAELRRRLGADAVTVEREPAPDEGLGSSETIRMVAPHGSLEVRTGHAAVATELERALGIRVPFGELMARALAYDDPDHVGRWFPAAALAERRDDETFALAAEAAASAERDRRHFAAEVLLRYGLDGDGPEDLAERTVDLLRRRAVLERDPSVLERVITGLGEHVRLRALPEIRMHAAHPAASVRGAVAFALWQFAPAGDTAALATLLALCRDRDAHVRRPAMLALADSGADTPAVRAALARGLDDPDARAAVHAARGLGLRGDRRADLPLVRAFLDAAEDGDPELSPAWDVLRGWPRDRFDRLREALR